MLLYLSFLLPFAAAADAVNAGFIQRMHMMPMNDGRIVGGSRINISEVPYQVSINTHAFGHFCGGSIIDKKWVITAAHCTDSYKNQAVPLLRIRAGSSRKRSGGEVIYAKKIHQHPKFTMKTIDYDFSLIELIRDLTIDETKEPVELPDENSNLEEGTMCMITGWGHTQNLQEHNAFLRAAQVPIFNQDTCKKAYDTLGTVTDRMLCAGYPKGGKDACQGDSGGPLVANNVLVGVISWGYGCAKPSYPGVYAKITSVRDWIKQVTGI